MKSIFRIIAFTRHLWFWYMFMGIFVIAVSLLSLVIPLLSKQIVDIIVSQINGAKIEFSQFYQLLIFIIITDVFITILTALGQWIGDILAVKLQTYLASKYYEHVLNLHIGYYDNEITGKIVNKMYRGITSISEFIQSMLNNFLPFFLTAIVTIILLSRYSFFIGLLLFALFPLYILISHASSMRWIKFEDKKNLLNDTSQGRVFESLSGIRIVKSFTAQAMELYSYINIRKEIETLSVGQSKQWHGYDFFRRFSLNIILFAIYAYIVYWTFNKHFTLGEMTLLLQLVNQARFPLFAMSFILGQIQQAGAGSADFFKVLETKSNIKDSENAVDIKMDKKLDKSIPLVKIENLSFSYESKKSVLKNINLDIFANEKLALVGESGEGKSTLVNLLLRFYEAQHGRITIRGQDINLVTQNSLHSMIAVVFQESLLFSGTVKENILYGFPKAKMEDVIASSKAANAHEFISKLPHGYDSLVGERGVKLSGGQKQRLAIARAILKNAPIIILDEATSALDSKSELEVQKGLDSLMKNRTTIIIAHRLSTIAGADHILVLYGGKVAQYGTSKQLLREKDGIYFQMVSLQKELLKVPDEVRKNKLQKYDLVG